MKRLRDWIRRRRLAARKPLLYRREGGWVCQSRGSTTTPRRSAWEAWLWLVYSD